ncbi:hypothetical protein [Paenibacillus piri]|uniref:Uncharacterized protein n=1 Tax=Paenibacillus piri TaxID=2547395 RepID=A0A4R5K7H8_9BACL|nr:hypothetical protein [Paenibacillus piri]TDF90092.1 hypothetical protein E1757_34155 [Paenibacillus piri]
MFRKMLRTHKWKRLRIRIWEKRLLSQLTLISHRLSPAIQCSLHLSWGPFYGGSVILDRTCKKAKIYIQIPYDRYTTSDEQQVMFRYRITANALPYFIFFHECFHLIDVLSYLQHNEGKGLETYQATMKSTVRASNHYRSIHVEQCADDFAYQQYMDLCEKAG